MARVKFFHLAQKSERAVFNGHEASGRDLLNIMPKYACFRVALEEIISAFLFLSPLRSDK